MSATDGPEEPRLWVQRRETDSLWRGEQHERATNETESSIKILERGNNKVKDREKLRVFFGSKKFPDRNNVTPRSMTSTLWATAH